MDILCFSSSDWDGVFLRKQHIMRALSEKSHRVIFVNPPRASKWTFARGRNGLTKINDNLWIYDPVVLPFMSVSEKIRYFNYRIIKRRLNKIISGLGFKDVILWLYGLYSEYFIGKFNEVMTVFDSTQYFPADNYPEKIKQKEYEILKKSDVVFGCYERITEHSRKHNPNTYLVRHGVDFEHYRKLVDSESALKYKTLPKPVVGFCGSVSRRPVDVELLSYVAEKRPDWTILLVGPLISGHNIDDLLCFKNMVHTGFVDFDSLPAFLKLFDVGIIPYRVTEFTSCIVPIKFYEYLACGLPVVSTGLSELGGFGDFVYTSENRKEFLSNIERALKEDSDGLKSKRLEFAKQNDWNARAEEMIKKITPVYEEKLRNVRRTP